MCWYLGALRRQGVSSQGIGLVISDYSDLSTRRANSYYEILITIETRWSKCIQSYSFTLHETHRIKANNKLISIFTTKGLNCHTRMLTNKRFDQSLTLETNGRHFAEHIFDFMFMYDNLIIKNSMGLSPLVQIRWVSIGSDKGLVPSSWQAIIRTINWELCAQIFFQYTHHRHSDVTWVAVGSVSTIPGTQ